MRSKSAFFNVFLNDRIVGRLEKTNSGQIVSYFLQCKSFLGLLKRRMVTQRTIPFF